MFIVLSLFAAYLILLGCAAAPAPKPGTRLLDHVALALGLGILLNYTLVLTGLKLSWVLLVGAAFAVVGAVRFTRRFKRGTFERPLWPSRSFAWSGLAVYILVIYYIQILADPLKHWDARSIWFFHAKMIWVGDGLRASGGWAHPSLAFSHPDYPHLVPALAAQLASLNGYWNEFLPKGALWIVLVPLVLWVFTFRRAGIAFVLLLTLYFFSLDAWLWNGYMDAYVVMYSALALLLLGRFAAERNDTDLQSAVCVLGIAANVKNEGALVALCAAVVVAILGFRVRAFRLRDLGRRIVSEPALATPVLLAVLPTLLWSIHRRTWGLSNYLTADLPGGFGLAANRLTDGRTAFHLFRFLTTQSTVAWLLLSLIAILAIFSWYRRVNLHPGAVIALAFTVLYFCGIYTVYMITPKNLDWQLSTSATRVMAMVSFGLLSTIFFQLSALSADRRD